LVSSSDIDTAFAIERLVGMEQQLPGGCAAGGAPCASRRAVLAMAGAAGLAALSGCQVYGGGDAPPAPPAGGGATGGEPAAPPADGGGAAPLARTADIPVGSGKIFKDKDVVVTQPQAGTFKAFSATCTHAGCPVVEVKGGTINCDCHGSKFKIADGSVAGGPAPRPLAARNITIDGGSITLA
jgi:Rieske Fe-S protein